MNKQKVIQLLSEFITIQSVSTDLNRYHAIRKCADFLRYILEPMGFDVRYIEYKDKEGIPPLLIAYKEVDVKAKTIGIYGHYDVQPEDPVDEWESEPFTLTSKNGRFVARGIADNKGHIIQNIVAIQELIESKQLINNILFVLEGEEEKGSLHLEELFQHAVSDIQKVDVFYVTDVGMKSKTQPQLFYGLRGLVYFDLHITTGERDLHSGIYGNVALNPAQVLMDLILSMKDVKTGTILIEGIYDDVRTPHEDEMNQLNRSFITPEALKQEAGILALQGSESPIPLFLRSKILPSLDVHGVVSGFTGEGSKTIIPREARVKFSIRLVEKQDPDKIEYSVQEHIKSHLPQGVEYVLKTQSKSAPFYTSLDNEFVKNTSAILKEEFANEVLLNRSGGSIPVAEILQRLFQKPVILMGFTQPDDHIHSPNENFPEDMFWKGITVLKKIYQ
ncbi:MAG: M20/M25/M40 family metallo-hydrolase [Candidatus Roizmanbacteria bacterium]